MSCVKLSYDKISLLLLLFKIGYMELYMQEMQDNKYYLKGLEYMNIQDYIKAYHCFEQAADTESDEEYYSLLQLKCMYMYYLEQENLEEKLLLDFLNDCDKFLEKSSGKYDVSVYIWSGNINIILSEYNKAIEQFNKAVKIDASLLEAHYGLGKCYYNLSRYNKAIQYFDKVISADDNSYDAYRFRGFAKYFLDYPLEDSFKDLYKAYELDSNNINIVFNILSFLVSSKDYNKAHNFCDKYIQLNPQSNEGNMWRVIIAYLDGCSDISTEILKMGYRDLEFIKGIYQNRIDNLNNSIELSAETFYLKQKLENDTCVYNAINDLMKKVCESVKICTFCGKIEDEVKHIIERNDIYICNECLELCDGILQEECCSYNYMVKSPKQDTSENNELVCSFCGRAQAEVEKLIAADNINICNGCVEVCKNVITNHTNFETEYQQKLIRDFSSENHQSFYESDNENNKQYFAEKTLSLYGKSLIYKYLVKAAHILKKHNCNRTDRKNVLFYLQICANICLDSALSSEIKFDEEKLRRIITVGMEIAFHRIVVLYKHNLLNNPTNAKDLVDYLATLICSIEMSYIKNNNKLRDTYMVTQSIIFKELKEYIRDWLDAGLISKDQFDKILDKSFLIYLTPEISELMHTKSQAWKNWLIFFFLFFLLKAILFYCRHH